jgi:hypothetical protein
MEAVAAVGIAAAAAQFLDFSIKTLALCKEIRDSSSGSTKTNDELTKSIKKLTAMQKDLRQNGSTPSSTYRQLIRAVQDCSVVASELLKLLEDIREVAKKSLGTMRSALKAIKERKSIEKLQARLLDCQNRYHIALTTDLRDEVLRLLERQGKNTDSMRDIILQRLDKASAESAASHSITQDKLRTLGDDLNRSTGTVQKRLSALHISQQSSSRTLRTGQRSLGKQIDGQSQRLSASDTHQKFLDTLYFPEMFARQESIKRRSPGTYDWVFSGEVPNLDDWDFSGWIRLSDPEMDKELRGRISCWLRNTDKNPLFWISGKPGSGKSSLVSFIMDDRRTKECMRPWAGGRDPHIFSFFFWKPGSNLQKSMLGLRRSLLWQLCKAKPVIVEKLLSQDSTLLYSPCTDDKLAIALDLALSYYQNESVLFLIDGLDECEGSHNDLLNELHGTRFGQRSKICLSSRPEEALRRRLEDLPSIRLQDLNWEDISKYAHTALKAGDQRTMRLAYEVTRDAEGVFLWAVLVCKSLSAGMMAKDDEETMLRRLRTYPKGLDDLFNQMFSDIEEIHHKSLALYFYAARQPVFSVALAVASQHPRKIMSVVEFGELCEREVIRITAQSKGLLQIDDNHIFKTDTSVWAHTWALRDVSNNQTSKEPLEERNWQILEEFANTKIALVHRSAYDYISDLANNECPTWLRHIGKPEMIHNIFEGTVWFSQYQPIVVAMVPPEIGTRQHTEYEAKLTPNTLLSQLRAIATDDFSKLDRERLYEGLDKYLDAIHTWTSVQRRDTTGTLSTCVGHGRPAALIPWTNFWRCIMQFEPRFLTSRLNWFWDCDDAYFETIALFSILGDRSSLSTENYHALRSALTKFQFRGRANSSIADFPYAGEQRYCFLASEEDKMLYSWLGTGISHEWLVLRNLYTAVLNTLNLSRINTKEFKSRGEHTQESRTQEDLISDILIFVYAIRDTWKLFVGIYVEDLHDGEILQPLQLSLPFYYAESDQFCPMGEEAMMQKNSSCRSTLRLSCFANNGPDRLVFKGQHLQEPLAFATATYHLSTETTAVVVAHSIKRESGISRITTGFVGTTAERSRCTNLILTDLWDDVDGQLTAWEQLYARACVKRYFAWYWKLPEEISDWGDSSEEEPA